MDFWISDQKKINVSALPSGKVGKPSNTVYVPLGQFPGVRTNDISVEIVSGRLHVGMAVLNWYHMIVTLRLVPVPEFVIENVPLIQEAFDYLTFWIWLNPLKDTQAGKEWLLEQEVRERAEQRKN